MPDLKLYYFPGTCARVAMTALEKIGCAYESEVVNILQGDHFKPPYAELNPHGKVPLLVVDGKPLKENAAILSYLEMEFPDAGLFPEVQTSFDKARILADLFWLSSIWHPSTRVNMMPASWTTGDPAPVQEKGRELLMPHLKILDAILAQQAWYYGDVWSIVDSYFYWSYTTAAASGFDLSPFANILRHLAAIEALPAHQATLANEGKALSQDPELAARLAAIMAGKK